MEDGARRCPEKRMKLFVAATRQNDGKTVTAMGLLNAFRERFSKVGYIKPVGQQFNMVGNTRVDKDASLMEDVFHIGGNIAHTSPITVPRGFTEKYIESGSPEELKARILEAYQAVAAANEFIVIEGTGHAGVGAVFDVSNADVAKLIGAKVILVTCAGIGRPIDEVSLNKAVFEAAGVPILGVIVNKVLQEKYEKIDKYVRLGFKRKGIDVLGVVPFFKSLANPTIRQLFEDIDGELLGKDHGLNQTVNHTIVGAMPCHTALDYFKGEVLLITAGSREDLILTALASSVLGVGNDFFIQGIILTGGIKPNKSVLTLMQQANIPIMLVKDDTYKIAQKINQMTIKIRSHDTTKITKAKAMIKQYVDIDRIIQKLQDLNDS